MCDECKTVFGAIADREVRCRTSGCKKTWTWSRGDQLDACLAGKPVPKAAARMCQSCLDIYSKLKDVERPCRRTTCKRTWTDKRGAQLARAVRGKTGDPYPHYCAECEKELGELEDRQVPCKTDHCTGTWTWTSAQQLAAGVRPVVKDDETRTRSRAGGSRRRTRATRPQAVSDAGADAAEHDEAAPGAEAPADGAPAAATPGQPGQGQGQGQGKGRKGRGRNRKRRREPRPPERRCEACIEFLKDRKTHEIPCSRCATAIYWPPESQLQTHLGNWAEPSLCGACKRDATEAARAAQREALRHPTLPGAPRCRGRCGDRRGQRRTVADGGVDVRQPSSNAHPPLHDPARARARLRIALQLVSVAELRLLRSRPRSPVGFLSGPGLSPQQRDDDLRVDAVAGRRALSRPSRRRPARGRLGGAGSRASRSPVAASAQKIGPDELKVRPLDRTHVVHGEADRRSVAAPASRARRRRAATGAPSPRAPQGPHRHQPGRHRQHGQHRAADDRRVARA